MLPKRPRKAPPMPLKNWLRILLRFGALCLVCLVSFQLGRNRTLYNQLSLDIVVDDASKQSSKNHAVMTTKNDENEVSVIVTLMVMPSKTAVFDHTSLLSYKQSFGFFDDILDDEWRLVQKKVKEIYPNTNGDPYQRGRSALSNAFFQNHYEPDFVCRHERRIGRLGDGGKWVCDPHRLAAKIDKSLLLPSINTNDTNANINSTTMNRDTKVAEQQQPSQTLKMKLRPPPCLVYSIGSNGDSSFESSIKHDIGPHCEIHVFDMDDYSSEVSKTGAIFHQWGISDASSIRDMGIRKSSQHQGQRYVFKTLNQTVHELGHVGRTIDIFKIDCEGCEKTIFPDFFLPGIDMRQILIELHASEGSFLSRTLQLVRPVDIPETPDFFHSMYQHGYVIFHKEANIQYSIGAWAIEYCFLKLHPDFFQNIPQLYQTMTLE